MSKRKKKSSWLLLLLLHRYTGLTAAFFVILLSVTGILLNHTQELSLSKHHASTPWLMEMYGIDVAKISQTYAVEVEQNGLVQTQWVLAFDGSAYLAQQMLTCKAPLVGALYTNDMLLIANAKQLCLFTTKGEMIDVLSLTNKDSIKRIGQRSDKSIVFESATTMLTLNNDYTDFVPVEPSISTSTTTIRWSATTKAPDVVSAALLKQHQGSGLPWERVILDLHSGRIVGLAGVYFMDFIALLLIFLSLSGITLWVKRTFFKRKK